MRGSRQLGNKPDAGPSEAELPLRSYFTKPTIISAIVIVLRRALDHFVEHVDPFLPQVARKFFALRHSRRAGPFLIASGGVYLAHAVFKTGRAAARILCGIPCVNLCFGH